MHTKKQAQRIKRKLSAIANKAITAIHQITGASRRINICGKLISIPFTKGVYCIPAEPWMSTLLTHILKEKQGAFIDVGVNLGQTLAKVKAIDPSQQYIGFEPNPNCFFYLHHLITENNWKNLRIFPFAIGASPGIANIIFNSTSPIDPSASVIEGLRDPSKALAQNPITIMPIEYALKQFDVEPKVSIIKIDTEGSELEVLESIQTIISNHTPILLIELLPIYSESNIFRLRRTRQAEELLYRHKYQLFNIRKDSNDEFLFLHRVNAIEIHSSLSECDYIAIHEDDAHILKDLEIDSRRLDHNSPHKTAQSAPKHN